jgi:hypothetical protein
MAASPTDLYRTGTVERWHDRSDDWTRIVTMLSTDQLWMRRPSFDSPALGPPTHPFCRKGSRRHRMFL